MMSLSQAANIHEFLIYYYYYSFLVNNLMTP